MLRIDPKEKFCCSSNNYGSAAEFELKARTAGLLAHLDQEFDVEAELSARRQHGSERGKINRVLALVVGDAAAVVAAVDFGELGSAVGRSRPVMNDKVWRFVPIDQGRRVELCRGAGPPLHAEN